MKKCCGTCEYGNYDEMQGYVCVNHASDKCADFVDYENFCEEWSGKNG
jgi:hypothetical protein